MHSQPQTIPPTIKNRRRVLHRFGNAILLAFCIVAATPASHAANTTLPKTVSSLLQKNGIGEASISVLVAAMGSGEIVLQLNQGVFRNPASVQKLVTTLAALELLGPAYQWQTRYLIVGKIANGRLQGNLVLQGGGDPFLTVERLWRHVIAIRQRGIRDIEGRLIIDNSLFNIAPHDRRVFDGKPQRVYNVEADAALINLSATRFVIAPRINNDAAGGIAVFADPPLANLVINNNLSAQTGKCISPNSGWSMTLNRKHDNIIATFDGQYRTRCGGHSVARSILNNQEYTYQLFRHLWQSSGGTLAGGYQLGITPDNAQELIALPSLTLAEYIIDINKFSNNVMARQLLLTIGTEQAQAQGADTRQTGIAAIKQWLDQIGIPPTGWVMENGAGLSRISRLSASQIHQLLEFAWHSTWRPEFVASLPLAAVDGTMKTRLQQSALQGRARIKTGLINNVRSMAGYVHAKNGKHYAVVMMIDSNKVNYYNGNQIQDALLQWAFNL